MRTSLCCLFILSLFLLQSSANFFRGMPFFRGGPSGYTRLEPLESEFPKEEAQLNTRVAQAVADKTTAKEFLGNPELFARTTQFQNDDMVKEIYQVNAKLVKAKVIPSVQRLIKKVSEMPAENDYQIRLIADYFTVFADRRLVGVMQSLYEDLDKINHQKLKPLKGALWAIVNE